MWELDSKESWAPKNWCFKLWCWNRLLRVPWTARRSNQSILKEISPECSLEGLMLKLKLQYFGHLMQRNDSLEKTLMLGKIEGRRRRIWQKMRWLDGITDSMEMSLSKLQEMVEDREACYVAPHGVSKSWTGLWDWTRPTFQINHKWIYAYLCHVTFCQKSLLSRITTAVWLVSSLALHPLSKCLLFVGIYYVDWASLVAKLVKNSPAMQETWV